jgi:hypothetical protein
MSNLRTHHRHRSARRSAMSVAAVSIVAIALTLLACESVAAQSTRSSTATPAVQAAVADTLGSGPDLQGLWDFTMRVGERTSTGFFALGPCRTGMGRLAHAGLHEHAGDPCAHRGWRLGPDDRGLA